MAPPRLTTTRKNAERPSIAKLAPTQGSPSGSSQALLGAGARQKLVAGDEEDREARRQAQEIDEARADAETLDGDGERRL